MSQALYFITHPEVVVDPAVPVPQWPLSERGRDRMRRLLARDWFASIAAIHCSAERKAIDGAAILAEARGTQVHTHVELGEIDRSATGYLPHDEHEATADALFAHPEQSIRGWESARSAQERIVRAVSTIAANCDRSGPVAVVSHGGVGTLLLCHLRSLPIARVHEQPGSSGGHYFLCDFPDGAVVHGWRAIDAM